ncbi:MAG: type ISP restriction/modification enzyme, partial [Deltaproteobacteria bacterium]|nr:type ISP restriction/modification enzyme [Deltaproteobacteria bacterium]
YQETSRDDGSTSPNYSPRAIGYLSTIDKNQKSAGAINPQIIWLHALAIGYSPLYLADNTDGIRQDWPRIPLPSAKKALLASAELGNQVAMRLDTETPVPGVTSGKLRPELKGIAVIFRVGGGQISSDSERLALTAGWGHSGKGGVTMPGKGKILARDYAPDEMEAISAGAKALGLTTKQALKHLGERTCDVYLNNEAYWKNVPSRVWDYVIGGYQVIKKWLSYRERALLGRPLRLEEAREVTDMGRRIAAIVLLEPRLDENYVACKQDAYPWPSESG